MSEFINAMLHLDVTLAALITDVGAWVYAILFGVILAETGFVIMPFLPGDSLIFAAGAFAAVDLLNLGVLLVLLCIAAIIGDTINYMIGRKLGDSVIRTGKLFGIPIKREYLEKTQLFYQENGAKTIVFARFIPIIRTFAPFIAGVGRMNYATFVFYNVMGGIGWVTISLFAGYYFGNIQWVKDNFTVVMLAVIFISILPGLIAFIVPKKKTK